MTYKKLIIPNGWYSLLKKIGEIANAHVGALDSTGSLDMPVPLSTSRFQRKIIPWPLTRIIYKWKELRVIKNLLVLTNSKRCPHI